MAKPLICSVKYFCLGAFLIFLGSVLLCGLGLTVVLPHEATRNWPKVTCQVTNSSYNSRICSCAYQASEPGYARSCLDSYPCLKVIVSFEVPGPATRGSTPSNGLKESDIFYRVLVESKQTDIRLEGNGIVHRNAGFADGDPGYRTHGSLSSQSIQGQLYRSWEDLFYREVSKWNDFDLVTP
ncbi:hypothetical protein LSH36_545g03021 [Paralvinella palmiformis]|uniref:Uncharacterized protein n=1 Tax=Paralvinella palmiformis TaxID=53620 RepID=A0AAD9J8D4_9ANNE|nr:hypothetical protein LSH36_545g03021 [Paralvinella palmiformis]